MTVSSNLSKVLYAGDGTTAVFAVPFVFANKADVVAILRDAAGAETTWVENTQYTLTGAGNPNGGTLTVKTIPTDYRPKTGETLVIKRVVPLTQQTDYPEGGEFPAAAHEAALDKLTRICQQLQEQIDRNLTAPETDQSASLAIPNESQRAGKFLSFDAGGNPIAAAGTSANLGPVSAFIDTLLDDADAPTARATLGAQEDVVVAEGDLVVGDANGKASRLPAGAEGQVLGVSGGTLAYTTGVPTGTVTLYVGSAAPSGWLLLNGDTIGNTNSGATQAGPQYQTLFELLWNSMADSEAPVSGGRGADATSDWNADKTITLPDARGRVALGTGAGAGLTARTHGAKGGQEDASLVSHSHGAGTLSAASAGSHSHTLGIYGSGAGASQPVAGSAPSAGEFASAAAGAHTHAITGATDTQGAAAADKNMPPWLALNFIVKV